MPVFPLVQNEGLPQGNKAFEPNCFLLIPKSANMATRIEKLSRLMTISWAIQRRKRSTRSKALTQAWAIIGNEDITVSYLVQRLNHHKPVKQTVKNQFSLFIQ